MAILKGLDGQYDRLTDGHQSDGYAKVTLFDRLQCRELAQFEWAFTIIAF